MKLSSCLSMSTSFPERRANPKIEHVSLETRNFSSGTLVTAALVYMSNGQVYSLSAYASCLVSWSPPAELILELLSERYLPANADARESYLHLVQQYLKHVL